MSPVDTAVLLITFNRPKQAAQVLDAIRKARPKKLYFASDGAREHKAGEAEKVQACRALVETIDWPCEVRTLFREKNLGCKMGVSSAIDWLFENEEEGIILEDDCLPNGSFFRFCQEMLERYRDDRRVMHISGDNFQAEESHESASYYFSKYIHVWGWATWRRAWELYDIDLIGMEEDDICNYFENGEQAEFWLPIFEKMKARLIDTWDYQWMFCCFANHGLAIMPSKNLVSNMGFGEDATHTTNADSNLSMLRTDELRFPLLHPQKKIVDYQKDNYTERLFFSRKKKKTIKEKIRQKLRSRK